MRTSDRYAQDRILVEEKTGTRTGDGFEQTGTSTVLDCTGDAQQLEAQARELEGLLDEGAVQFFATEDVLDVEPGMSATITLEDGRTLEATVERTAFDDRSLVLSLDG